MDEKAKIAICKCCLLASAMKDCKNWAFNIGLKSDKILENVTTVTKSPNSPIK